MTAKSIPPPDRLSDRAQALWRSVVPRRVRDPEQLILLQTALEALDRAQAAAEAVAADGMVTTTMTTGAKHVHPLLRVEAEARAMFLKAWRQLGLAYEDQAARLNALMRKE